MPARLAGNSLPSLFGSLSSCSASHACRSAADWDKLTAAVKKEEAEEKPEGEAGLNKVPIA